MTVYEDGFIFKIFSCYKYYSKFRQVFTSIWLILILFLVLHFVFFLVQQFSLNTPTFYCLKKNLKNIVYFGKNSSISQGEWEVE